MTGEKPAIRFIAAWWRGLVCLGLICALQVRPLTVIADGSFAQEVSTDSAVQVDAEDSAVQVDPEGSTVQLSATAP